jgi:hypothetical protein
MKAAMIPTGRIIGDKMVRAAKLATAHPLQAAGCSLKIMSAPGSSSSVPTRTEAGSRYL